MGSYGWHAHPSDKVLFYVEGPITFHIRFGNIELATGDRVDLAAGTDHAASVGPQGVTCRDNHSG